MYIEIPSTKPCKTCRIDKPLDAFSPLKGGKYGRHPHCRECRNESNKQKRVGETCIYALVDPFTDAICYIGKTTNPMLRLREHIAEAKCSPHINPRKARWLLALLSQQAIPKVIILEKTTGEMSALRETYWIQHYRELYPRLLNASLPTPNY